MKNSIVFLLMNWFGVLTVYSQPVKIDDLYPVIKKIPEERLEGYVISSGCVSGNCENGTGRFVVVSRSQCTSVTGKSTFTTCKLDYQIYDGQFSMVDSSFEGTCSILVLELIKKGKERSFQPTINPEWNDLAVAAKGRFIKATYKEYDKPPIPLYFKHGKVIVFNPSYESLITKWSPYAYIDGFYQQNELIYGSVVYHPNQSNSRFTGLFRYGKTGYFFGNREALNEPLFGTAIRSDGSIFSGYQKWKYGYSSAKNIKDQENNQLHESFIKVMPDTGILSKLLEQPEKNAKLLLKPSNEAPSPNFLRMRKQERQYTTEAGFIIGADQQPKPANYSGNGFFYANNRCWYVGSFLNGQPHGIGLFYLDARDREMEVEYWEHMVYGEFKEGAIVAADYTRNDFLDRIESPAYAAESLKRIEKEANAGNITAMWKMARQYYGSAKIKQPLKALEWLEKCANAGDSAATIFVANAYSGYLSYGGVHSIVFQKFLQRPLIGPGLSASGILIWRMNKGPTTFPVMEKFTGSIAFQNFPTKYSGMII